MSVLIIVGGTMGTKGEKTKELIVTEATKLFATNGYVAVTMKDICEACALSRGGLYQHFSSTKEIFLAMLSADKKDWQNQLNQAIAKEIPADKLLDYYLEQQKKSLINTSNGLAFAIHEFAFMKTDQREYIDSRFQAAIEILVRMLVYGQQQGIFSSFDATIMATHLVLFFDGLQTSSPVLTLSEQLIESQLKLVKEMVLKP